LIFELLLFDNAFTRFEKSANISAVIS